MTNYTTEQMPHKSMTSKSDWPVSGPVEAVVGQQIIVELPEDVKSDAAIGCRHIVVGF